MLYFFQVLGMYVALKFSVVAVCGLNQLDIPFYSTTTAAVCNKVYPLFN